MKHLKRFEKYHKIKKSQLKQLIVIVNYGWYKATPIKYSFNLLSTLHLETFLINDSWCKSDETEFV